MTRRLVIRDSDMKVTGLLRGPGEGNVGILLAPGAGAGQDSPFMHHLGTGLGAAGFPTLAFNYPYHEAGRRRPDPAARLLACHGAAASRLAERCDQVVLAGKSMGGRLGSHLAASGFPAAGLVYFAYPLVAVGKTDPRPTDHLEDVDVPQLFWCGHRDRMSPPPLIRALAGRLPEAEVREIPGADHSFRVPKSTGRPWTEVLDELVAGTSTFVAGLQRPRRGG